LTGRNCALTVRDMGEAASRPALWVESGGSGGPALLLLHGLGANATVWEALRPLLAQQWRGRWLAPDLRGHGRSGHGAPYSFGAHAADVAALLGQGEEVVVLGHSMGGAVAMALASQWFGVAVRQVIAFGVKLVWTAEETAKAQELARAPARWFATREEAIERYLRIAGLAGLVAPDSAAAAIGVVEEGGRFRLAADPRSAAVVGVPIEGVIAAMRAPLRLAAGARDSMVTLEQMRRFDPEAVLLEGLGHNPHVEAPERLWQLVEAALG
jgi:pimeloyl-ACP methyl ester carboxylesterase